MARPSLQDLFRPFMPSPLLQIPPLPFLIAPAHLLRHQPSEDEEDSDSEPSGDVQRPSRRWGAHNPFARGTFFRAKSQIDADQVSVATSLASSLYCSSTAGTMNAETYDESLVSDSFDVDDFSSSTA
jgi:hypothetical protein